MSSSKRICITGTSRGIGEYLAKHYLSRNMIVIGCSRGDATINHEHYHHYVTTVGDERQTVAMFRDIRKRYTTLDYLVNNAGIASMNHSLLTPGKTVERILNTNVTGTFLACREAAKLMQPQKFGRIVNMSTVATPLKLEGESVYAASKAAVVSLTEVMAKEFGPLGITVNAVGPTPIETDLIRSVPKEKIDRLIARQAVQRMGEFTDVANVIDFYLADESSFVSGQNIYLGGV